MPPGCAHGNRPRRYRRAELVYLQSPPDLHKTSKLSHPAIADDQSRRNSTIEGNTDDGGDPGRGAVAHRAYRPTAERHTRSRGPRGSGHGADHGRVATTWSARWAPRPRRCRGRPTSTWPGWTPTARPRRDLGHQAAQLRHRPALRRADAAPGEGAHRTTGAKTFRRRPRRLRLLRRHCRSSLATGPHGRRCCCTPPRR